MSKKTLNGVFHRIRKLAAVQAGRSLSDRELLGRFARAADEAAFATLVERHGPLVLGMCRRVLGNVDDAEDACQATFLVLARKAKSLRKRAGLGGWLHGVAYRIAANLKRQRTRRQKREQLAPCRTAYECEGDITWRELRTVLDEELQQLPERYRAPLILCYLSGKTRDEAAQELGASPGAIHGRLERGRKMLRERLTQRGLTLSSALFATALTASTSQAALPATFVVASTKCAIAIAAGHTLAIAPQVLSLAQEALKIMFVTKLKIGTAFVVSCGILAALAAGWIESVGSAQDYVVMQIKRVVNEVRKGENDEAFIRRVSKDLRGVDPSPAEIHFFTANKDANRRQKLIDLFIQERQAKQKADTSVNLRADYLRLRATQVLLETWIAKPRGLHALQADFYKQLQIVTTDKVATITQNYLNRLMTYVKEHPKAEDISEALLQISLIYRSQGKNVEADAWRDKLRKEHPASPAAKTAEQTSSRVWLEAHRGVDSGMSVLMLRCEQCHRAAVDARGHFVELMLVDDPRQPPKTSTEKK